MLSFNAMTALLCLLSVLALTIPSTQALTYGFSESSPVICFVEEQSQKGRAIIGEYTWPKDHIRSDEARLSLELRHPDGSVLGKPKPMQVGTHSFTFKPRESDGIEGEIHLCATLEAGSAITDTLPLKIAFNVDQERPRFSGEGVTEAMRNEYNQKKATRETHDSQDILNFQEFGGQIKSVLRPKVYLQEVEKNLDILFTGVENVLAEMSQSMSKADAMRSTTESTFTRVWVWGLFIVAVTCATVSWQFSQLKRTLKRKKKI